MSKTFNVKKQARLEESVYNRRDNQLITVQALSFLDDSTHRRCEIE